jgi:integrase
MPILRLTDSAISELDLPDRRIVYHDELVVGLAVRVTANGHKSWTFMYRAGRRRRRLTLGRFPSLTVADARKAAREAQRRVGLGEDPAEAKRILADALSFDELADLYIERYAKPNKRSWRQDVRQLRVFCRRPWGSLPANAVDRARVRELLAQVTRERSGVISNRLASCISKLFAWGVAEGYLEENAVVGLTRQKEHSRERVLTDREVVKFWKELATAEARWLDVGPREAKPPKALSPDVVFWLRLRFVTAQRGGDVAGLEWRDVDFERALWQVPSERFKNGHAHVCPFGPWALEMLKDRREARSENRYVCQGGRGLAARSGVGPAFSIENFDPHDLRRTASTRMAQCGVTQFIIARVLGHADATVTGIYNRWEYLEEKRTALVKWEAYAKALLGGVA